MSTVGKIIHDDFFFSEIDTRILSLLSLEGWYQIKSMIPAYVQEAGKYIIF